MLNRKPFDVRVNNLLILYETFFFPNVSIEDKSISSNIKDASWWIEPVQIYQLMIHTPHAAHYISRSGLVWWLWWFFLLLLGFLRLFLTFMALMCAVHSPHGIIICFGKSFSVSVCSVSVEKWTGTFFNFWTVRFFEECVWCHLLRSITRWVVELSVWYVGPFVVDSVCNSDRLLVCLWCV